MNPKENLLFNFSYLSSLLKIEEFHLSIESKLDLTLLTADLIQKTYLFH